MERLVRAAGVVYVAVVQAQVDQMGNAHQQATDGHHHRMRHGVVMQRLVQHAGPQRDQAGDQEAQRTQRAMAAVTPDQAEQPKQGHEQHQRLFNAVAQPERQAQRGRCRQQHRDDCAMHRAQHRTGGTETVEQVAQA